MDSFNSVLSKEPLELVSWLSDFFDEPIPESINSLDELDRVGQMLSSITNNMSYLLSLDMTAKIYVRRLKRAVDKNNPKTKDDYEDMVDRQYVIGRALDILKQKYSAVSRMITTKQEMNRELSMSE